MICYRGVAQPLCQAYVNGPRMDVQSRNRPVDIRP